MDGVNPTVGDGLNWFGQVSNIIKKGVIADDGFCAHGIKAHMTLG